MKKFIEEFKAFAMRGNVIDMAVGVVIGGAFGKITTSIVNDIIMPLISMITGGINFSIVDERCVAVLIVEETYEFLHAFFRMERFGTWIAFFILVAKVSQ